MKKLIVLVKVLTAISIILLFAVILLPLPKSISNIPVALANGSGNFLSVDGYTGYYKEYNSTSNKHIVLIHGFGSSTYTWELTIPALISAGYHIISVDLKGFGLTQKGLDVDYSHDAQADYVMEILNQRGIAKATFVGHSMGGNIITKIAMKNPELVDRLVFVDPAIMTQNSKYGYVLTKQPIRKIMQQVLLQSFNKSQIEKMLKSAYYDDSKVTQVAVEAYFQPLTIKNWELALLGMVRDSRKNAVDIAIVDKNLPVLIVWGENDSWIPISQSELLINHFENETFVKLPNTGHVAQEEQPEKFNRILLDFLNK